MNKWRSALFIPGDDEAKLSKATTSGCDAVIVDLEDSVASSQKSAARRSLAPIIQNLSRDCDVMIRINSAWLEAWPDLEAAVFPGVAAIMVPKVEDPTRLEVVSEIIGELAAARGLATGGPEIVALVESPAGLAKLSQLSAVERVCGLAFGSEDFSLSLGVAPTSSVLTLPCQQIALAASIRDLDALAVPASIARFRDDGAFRAAAETSYGFGVTGALCIHPRQVMIANEVFRSSDVAIERAQALIKAWTEAGGDSAGVATFEGMMIDPPVVERARRLVARAALR